MAKRARNSRNGSRRKRRSSPAPPPDFWATNGRKIIGAVFVIAIVIVAAYVVVNYESEEPDGPKPVNLGPAPTFNINSIDGAPVDLEAYRGRIVVLDLFATWCGPCEQQMEALNALRSLYPQPTVEIISVDVDPQETVQDIRDFRDRFNADWTFAADTDDLKTKYDAGNIPAIAIIDRDGNLVWRHVGVATLGTLKTQIDPLI